MRIENSLNQRLNIRLNERNEIRKRMMYKVTVWDITFEWRTSHRDSKHGEKELVWRVKEVQINK